MCFRSWHQSDSNLLGCDAISFLSHHVWIREHCLRPWDVCFLPTTSTSIPLIDSYFLSKRRSIYNGFIFYRKRSYFTYLAWFIILDITTAIVTLQGKKWTTPDYAAYEQSMKPFHPSTRCSPFLRRVHHRLHRSHHPYPSHYTIPLILAGTNKWDRKTFSFLS